ncbi:MAG: cell division protein FtsL [Oscillospiraceae bacterium]
MARNINLAYDYSKYDNELQETERKIKQKQNRALKPKKYQTIKYMGVALAVLALFCSIIYGKVEMTELYEQQTAMEQQLTQLTSENVSLESELATKTGLKNVEKYAEDELGLKKLDKSQIEYVEVPKDTVAEVVKDDKESTFVKIKNWFSGVLEYLGIK